MTDPITLADEAEERSAAWLATTRRLLSEATEQRSEPALRRAVIRLDSDRFKALHRDLQDELWAEYAQAMRATGSMFP